MPYLDNGILQESKGWSLLVEIPAGDDPIVILLPVFNDWEAAALLLEQLDGVLSRRRLEADVVLVDDGSSTPGGIPFCGGELAAVGRMTVLRLRRNLGHQRAIAVGLAYIEANVPCRAVVVMDGDGEDDPRDVPRLLQQCQAEQYQKIVFAERSKRSEGWGFCVFYAVYQLLHRLLTGQRVRVGNFSVIPRRRLASLVGVAELWNHYAAAVFKSRQPCCGIAACRASRLAGRSRMSFVNLVIHGLSAISVHSDVVGVRLLIASLTGIALAAASLAAIVAIRLLTTLAIPGWATSAAGLLAVVLLQLVLFSIVFCFMTLSNRQGTTMLPLRDYPYFVAAVEQITNPRSQIPNLESQISNLESQITNLVSQISNLEPQISHLESQIPSLESRAPTASVVAPTAES